MFVELQAIFNEYIFLNQLRRFLVGIDIDGGKSIIAAGLLIPYNFVVGHIIEYLKEERKALLFLFVVGDVLVYYFDLLVFDEMGVGFR